MGKAARRRRERPQLRVVAAAAPKPRVLEKIAPVLIVLAALAAYNNSFGGSFVLDDHAAIGGNPTIRSFSAATLSPPARTAVDGRPLVNVTLALNYAIGGLDPTSYHVFNVIVHATVAVLLFGIARRTLVSPRLRDRYGANASGLATAVALLWAVHPLTTDAVAYVVQRTELLMALFFLLTLFFSLRRFETGRWIWEIAALASFALGLGCKEVIGIAPAVVLAYDWLFWSPSFRELVRRRWRLYAGFAVILAAFILLADTRMDRLFQPRGEMSPWAYLLTQSGVIVHYLRLAVWPNALSGDYDGWPIATSALSVLPTLLAATALVAVTVWGLRRKSPLAFPGAFFLLVLAPTSSVRPIVAEVAAERRMYLPLAAVVVLAVLAGHAVLRRLAAPRWSGVTVVAALAVVSIAATVKRSAVYETPFAFWSDVAAKRPDNLRARMWLANLLYRGGRPAEALEHYAAAVRIRPEDAKAHYGYAVVLANRGQTDRAIHHYRESLRISPTASAHNNLGMLLERRGATGEAQQHFRDAIRTNPRHVNARFNLARMLAGEGRPEEAVGELAVVLREQPNDRRARALLEQLERDAMVSN